MLTHRIVAYLIGLAVGYWVLTLAGKEKNLNKTVGQVIGWIIIVVSFVGPLCLAGSAIFCRTHSDTCSYSSGCPWNGGGMMKNHCPMMDDKTTDETKEKSK
jgi:hypothetical protein